ncbi:MAG: Unknown protein [uncultured Sulfurovum sp.]|uniref:Uncharacterized protein n=1 Tax=uncultured Sulfurovum sp. TaxID=269237 RepID=A0A6S6TM32_9BACT|nr:MAG: Unknown protein [uncultured Sulfurovum sp.]
MLGKIITFNKATNEGKILGENQEAYDFHIGEWLSDKNINVGQAVYYDVEEDEARNIVIDELLSSKYILHLKIDVSIVE